jgi:hypothetical protein
MADTNEKMDTILRYLNDCYSKSKEPEPKRNDIGQIVHLGFKNTGTISPFNIQVSAKILQDIELNEIDLILEYLCSEKLIEAVDKEYKILWKGKVFIESGGYQEYTKDNQREKKRETLRDRLLVYGSWLAGLAATGLVIVELLKHYLWEK